MRVRILRAAGGADEVGGEEEEVEGVGMGVVGRGVSLLAICAMRISDLISECSRGISSSSPSGTFLLPPLFLALLTNLRIATSKPPRHLQSTSH